MPTPSSRASRTWLQSVLSPRADRGARLPRALRGAALALLPTLCLAGPAAAQSTDGSSVDVAILDVLKARGIIGQAQYDELLALAREKSASAASEVDLIEGRLARLRAPDMTVEGGQPGKLNFKSADGKWSLNVKGKLQARVENVNSDMDSGDGTNFSVPRAYLGFEGTAGAPNVSYKFEFDVPTQSTFATTSTTKSPQLRDSYITWAFGPLAALRFGQFKVPYGREELISTFGLSLMERSIASAEFAPSYEPGAMLFGVLAEGVFEYYAGLSNGQGPGANNAAGEDRNGLRKSLRGVWNITGKPLKSEGPAFSTLADGSTQAAVGLSFNQNDDSTGKTTVTPGAQSDSWGLDGQVFSGPWSFLVDLFDRSSNLDGADNVHDTGDTLALGYFLVPDEWELVARTSKIDFDDADDRAEHTLGVNWYVDRHNGKWMLDFSKLQNDGATPDQDRIRLQYQLLF